MIVGCGLVIWFFEAVFLGLGTLVEKPGQERNGALVVAGGVALELHVWLWVPHVGPEVRVEREHGLVLVGLGTLLGKVERESGPPTVQSFKVDFGHGMLIVGVVAAKDDGQGLLLDHLYLSALVLGEATVEHWCSKLECGSDTGFEDSDQLVS